MANEKEVPTVEVVALKSFEFKGDNVKKGDKVTATKAQVEAMKTRGLIE